ncbi:hypothetical protein [Kitasatospora viridis]|uniref:Uncharacterized protein n=1 Tax=Kitasatospora viridis TaxID=281105 RepID=A0A561SAE7_9ACTN|nr:hypothetical protein [Kitasatospora viridis]TWF71817.1 hypothetical protein FHX73_1714 [Kitasatospora viridis]
MISANRPEHPAEPPVGVGDLVKDARGRERVVTDMRCGLPILRRRYGGEPDGQPADPTTLTVIARRGDWD